MKGNFIKILCSIAILSVFFIGCNFQGKEQPVHQSSAEYLSITDDLGRKITLPQKPKRIVVLSTSFLDLLYGVGGEAIGRPSSKSPSLFPASQGITEVGFIYNINNEQVLSLEPDLVIGSQGIHDKLIPILESSNIPVVMFKMKTYDEIKDKIKLFGAIAGTSGQAEERIHKMQLAIQGIVEKLPSPGKRVVILHATAKNVTVELDTSIAGNIAKLLHLENIAVGSKALDSDPEITPYSLEKLVQGDADIMLVVTMGNMADIEKRMKTDLASNPAWAGLRAVQNNQIFFLPSELFQLNPGIRYQEAVEYMAKIVYPEVYGHVK